MTVQPCLVAGRGLAASLAVWLLVGCTGSVSYTHLTLPTNREV